VIKDIPCSFFCVLQKTSYLPAFPLWTRLSCPSEAKSIFECPFLPQVYESWPLPSLVRSPSASLLPRKRSLPRVHQELREEPSKPCPPGGRDLRLNLRRGASPPRTSPDPTSFFAVLFTRSLFSANKFCLILILAAKVPLIRFFRKIPLLDTLCSSVVFWLSFIAVFPVPSCILI